MPAGVGWKTASNESTSSADNPAPRATANASPIIEVSMISTPLPTSFVAAARDGSGPSTSTRPVMVSSAGFNPAISAGSPLASIRPVAVLLCCGPMNTGACR
jgi:hypothetical protein